MSVQNKVLAHLNEVIRKPIETVYDLAGLITNCCTTVFDEPRIPDDFHFFDFFEHSIINAVGHSFSFQARALC